MDSKPLFRIHGKDYPVPEEFTLGELADMEREFHVDFNHPDDAQPFSILAATLWIAIRRVDDTVKVDDIRNLSLEDFKEVGGQSADPLAATNGSEPPVSANPISGSSTNVSDDWAGALPGSGGPTSVPSTDSALETSSI